MVACLSRLQKVNYAAKAFWFMMKTFQLVIKLRKYLYFVLGSEFEWSVFILSYKECSNAMQKMTSQNDWRERCRKMVKHQSLTPEGQLVLNLRIKAAIMYKFWTTQLKWEGFYVMGIGQLRGTFLGKTCLMYKITNCAMTEFHAISDWHWSVAASAVFIRCKAFVAEKIVFPKKETQF